ncbi:MAG: TRAM domain-containing protein [Candidatus Bathyarchaeia archaeon]
MAIVLVARTAIKGRIMQMPRRLPEKTRLREEKLRRYSQNKAVYPTVFCQEAPVKEGQKLEVVIDDVGSRGDGTTRMHGFLIFVPNAKIGERLSVRIVRVSQGFALAERVNELRGEN